MSSETSALLRARMIRMSGAGKAGSARSAVYWTVRQHPHGMHRKGLLLALDAMPQTSIESALTQLKARGLLAHDGSTGLWQVAEDAHADDHLWLSTTATLLIDDIADCDAAGVSVEVLARSFGLCRAEVHAALVPALASGQVARKHIDRALDGGLGYCYGQAGADLDAAVEPPRAANDGHAPSSEPAAPVPTSIGDLDFELLADKRFRIRWNDTLQVTLPVDVTRAMFRYLDELGGLRLVERLAAAEGAAP